MARPERKALRLPDFDDSASGAYFVTVCTQKRRCILSDISVGEGLAPPTTELTDIGKIVEDQLEAVSRRYPAVLIDKYVIMPNHLHLIVVIGEDTGGASPSPTLFDVLRVLKSLTTRFSRNQLGGALLWQRGYYEHVIRNEKDYREIRNTIDQNPARWAEDRYYETNS